MAEKGRSYRVAVSRSPGERRFALLEGVRVVEIVHRRDAEIQPGAIYAGRVGARVPGVDAVFVTIDGGLPGVLKTKSPPSEGTAIAVSIAVPPRADKGPELKAVKHALTGISAPALVAPARDPVRDWWERYGADIEAIVCDTPREAARIKQELGAAPISVHEGADLFGDLGVDDAIEAGLRPEVPLQGGGSLIIEATAAVTAIDINSGAGEPAAANHAAMTAVAHELRVRNIAGHIVVDVIPGKGVGALPRLLTKALAADPVSAPVAGVTPLGMIELTRQRLGLSLSEQLLDRAGALSAASVVYACLRAGVRQALRAKSVAVTITAAPEVVALLQGPLRAALTDANEALKIDIKLVAEPAFARAKFVCRTA